VGDDDYVLPVGKHHALRVLRAAYGKNAQAAYLQCVKMASGTADVDHNREDYVNIAAVYGLEHPKLMNASAPIVSKAAKQAISESWRKPNATELNPKVGQRMPGGKVSWVNEADEIRLFDIEKPGALVKRDRFNRPVGDYAASTMPPADDMGDAEYRENLFQSGARYLLWERSIWLAKLEQTDNVAWWSYRLVVEGERTYREAAKILCKPVGTIHAGVKRALAWLATIPPPKMGKEWRIGEPVHPKGSHEGYGWR